MLPLLLLIIAGACSTTKRLGPDQTLYTGVKYIKINLPDGEKVPSELISAVKSDVSVKPNNPMPLLSPYVRTPFPIGLWAWNNLSDSTGGLSHLLYKWLAKPPVLVGDVRPQLRTKLVEQTLADNGYFGSTATYDIVYDKRNPKKARINYTIDVAPGNPIDSIIYLDRDSVPVCRAIDSLARRNPYLHTGEVFCVDSLSASRVRIVNSLRNRGYYYMRPEFIEFLADTFLNPGKVALKITLADNVPPMALRQFRVGKIITTIERRSKRNPGTPDTIQTNRGELIVMRPARLRNGLIPECITMREGRLYTVRGMDLTQTRLSRLGIFSDISIQPIPADTSAANPTLDTYITCRFDRPIEVSLEVNATSKSNSYIGPGLVANFTHHNIFGGAEKFNLQLYGSYEWQTGRNRSSIFNSYEFGLNASLAFPRLLAPKFIPRTRRDINWTTITLSGSILNRPHYFKMAEYSMGITYEWRATRNTLHQFTPFKLTYNKLLHTTEAFDSVMALNPAIAESFKSRFIPQLSYTYTLDKWLERERINGINFTASFTEAGNLFDVLYKACGVKGEKKLFGTPFSQFIKGQLQLVYNRRLVRGSDQWLVSRALIGAEHAYGNSREVPYSEQFYIGGANSIRAFTVRSIGPGSYRSPRDQVNGYFDQTGTFKLELNTEYRFPIVSILHGAVFLDAGNIWLLKNDPQRPGGQLKASTFLRDIALGTGVGLRVDMGMMVIRGDLGYGLHTPYTNGTPHYFNVAFKDAFAFHLAIGYPF
ncbi:MAG: BamA/TamA family outer membrane protein [Muribaculaceae bacterium]|nr:BamA/TamA family outer membrane protein [Muribaculaceae bacterium]